MAFRYHPHFPSARGAKRLLRRSLLTQSKTGLSLAQLRKIRDPARVRVVKTAVIECEPVLNC